MSNDPAPVLGAIAVATRPAERDWFGDANRLFDSTPKDDPHEATAAAVGIWIGYSLFCEAIECLSDATADERRKLRSDLDYAHFGATEFLMMEAERAGLNPAPLAEEQRVCQELFRPVRGLGPVAAGSFGVVWFGHPKRAFDTWPECLGEWRYTLPPAMQDAIRQGEEVFNRLRVRLDIAATVDPGMRKTEQADTPGRGVPKDEAERRVYDWLLRNARRAPEDVTRDKVAEGTGVSAGSVSNTNAWKTFQHERKARRKPGERVIPLTDQMKAHIPADCAAPDELAQLIEEQERKQAGDERRHERRHKPS